MVNDEFVAQLTIEVVPGAIPQEQLVVRHAGGDPVDLVENDWGIYVDLAEGSVVPLHQHPQEQISYVVSGRLRFQVGDRLYEVGPGEAVPIPGDTLHAVWTLEPSLVIDTFTPPRADYLAADGD